MSAEGELITSVATFFNALSVILIYWLMSRSQGGTDKRMHEFKIDALQGFKGIALALVSKVVPLDIFDDQISKDLPEPAPEMDVLEYIKNLISAGFETFEKTLPLSFGKQNYETKAEPLPDTLILADKMKDTVVETDKNENSLEINKETPSVKEKKPLP